MTNWTTDRPTEPGEYWVSIEPSKRVELSLTAPVFSGLVYWSSSGLNLHVRWRDKTREECGARMGDDLFDGAMWSRRETPADPFEVTG